VKQQFPWVREGRGRGSLPIKTVGKGGNLMTGKSEGGDVVKTADG